MFDNTHFQVRGGPKEDLLSAIQLCMNIRGYKGAVSYKIDPRYGFIVYWSDAEKDSIPFPVQLGAEELCALIWKWLQNLNWDNIKTQYDVIPMNTKYAENSDIWNHRGWTIYTESWGHVNNSFYAYFAVAPAYLWLGK